MKKILLILLIGCTLQCIAQHHRDFDTEKEFLEFLTKITFDKEFKESLQEVYYEKKCDIIIFMFFFL